MRSGKQTPEYAQIHCTTTSPKFLFQNYFKMRNLHVITVNALRHLPVGPPSLQMKTRPTGCGVRVRHGQDNALRSVYTYFFKPFFFRNIFLIFSSCFYPARFSSAGTRAKTMRAVSVRRTASGPAPPWPGPRCPPRAGRSPRWASRAARCPGGRGYA